MSRIEHSLNLCKYCSCLMRYRYVSSMPPRVGYDLGRFIVVAHGTDLTGRLHLSIARHHVRSVKVGGVEPSWYYGRRPRENPWCCPFYTLCFLSILVNELCPVSFHTLHRSLIKSHLQLYPPVCSVCLLSMQARRLSANFDWKPMVARDP